MLLNKGLLLRIVHHWSLVYNNWRARDALRQKPVAESTEQTHSTVCRLQVNSRLTTELRMAFAAAVRETWTFVDTLQRKWNCMRTLHYCGHSIDIFLASVFTNYYAEKMCKCSFAHWNTGEAQLMRNEWWNAEMGKIRSCYITVPVIRSIEFATLCIGIELLTC